MIETGKIIGIARRSARREPMQAIASGEITVDAGLTGDFKGAKHKTRQITILAIEDWQAALSDLGQTAVQYPWTVRRANLLSEGLRLPRAKGARLQVGDIELEVTGQTYPCKRMDETLPGLLKALAPEWRGGVTCRVRQGGSLELGDALHIVSSPCETIRRLPG